jgi:hypothetical protein
MEVHHIYTHEDGTMNSPTLFEKGWGKEKGNRNIMEG